jgi:hypothetical protein
MSDTNWYDPIDVPLAAIRDPRTKSGHLSLILGLLAAASPLAVAEDLARLRFGDSDRGFPLSVSQAMRLAHFRDEASLRRYRADLAAWRYIQFTATQGRHTIYDIPSTHDHDFDFDAHTAIPRQFVTDERLKPGHVAAYVTLSAIAEGVRQTEWPRSDPAYADEAPTYATHCEATNRHIDELAGFSHSTQRNRYLGELVEMRHVRVVRMPRRGHPGRFELLTNIAAEQVLSSLLAVFPRDVVDRGSL